jgi:hypothetical protein
MCRGPSEFRATAAAFGRGYNPRTRAVSSVGRAPARQAGGHWFEPSTAHLRRHCANRRRHPIGRDDTAAVVHAALFDEQPEEFFRLPGPSLARISSSWSARPVSSAASGGVCARVGARERRDARRRLDDERQARDARGHEHQALRLRRRSADPTPAGRRARAGRVPSPGRAVQPRTSADRSGTGRKGACTAQRPSRAGACTAAAAIAATAASSADAPPRRFGGAPQTRASPADQRRRDLGNVRARGRARRGGCNLDSV